MNEARTAGTERLAIRILAELRQRHAEVVHGIEHGGARGHLDRAPVDRETHHDVRRDVAGQRHVTEYIFCLYFYGRLRPCRCRWLSSRSSLPPSPQARPSPRSSGSATCTGAVASSTTSIWCPTSWASPPPSCPPF